MIKTKVVTFRGVSTTATYCTDALNGFGVAFNPPIEISDGEDEGVACANEFDTLINSLKSEVGMNHNFGD